MTIILAPWGFALLRIASLCLFPFGRSIRAVRDPAPHLLVLNILWLPLGLAIVMMHVSWALVCVLSIVGIPFATQHLKIATMSLCPFTTFDDYGLEPVEVTEFRHTFLVPATYPLNYGTHTPVAVAMEV